jgi:hypothetical protein
VLVLRAGDENIAGDAGVGPFRGPSAVPKIRS